jgi:hypothetical protein
MDPRESIQQDHLDLNVTLFLIESPVEINDRIAPLKIPVG